MKKTETSSGTIILGPHRCGTSLITRLVAGMGHDLGGDLIPAAEDNPEGYWEHREVVESHNNFLRAVGRSWSDPLPFDSGVFSGAAASRTRDRIMRIFESDFLNKEKWALKDPRLCRLLPLWDDVLATECGSFRFVHVVRSPLAAAASLEKRDRINLEASLVLWLRHVIEAEQATRGKNRLWIALENIASDPVADVSRLAAWLDESSDETDRDIEALIAAVFRPDLLHKTETDADRTLKDFPWVAEVSRVLSSWATAEDPAQYKALDRVLAEISTADRLLIGHPLAAHQSRQREERLVFREEIEDFHQSVVTMRAEVATHRDETGHLLQSVTTMREEVSTGRQETDHLRSLIAELQQMVVRVENKHAELLSRSLDLTSEIEKKHLEQTKELHEAREMARNHKKDLEALHATYEELATNHHSLAGHLPILEEAILKKDSEITRVGRHITHLEETMQNKAAEITVAGDHITELEEALERAWKEKTVYESEQTRLHGMIQQLEQELDRSREAFQSKAETLHTMTNQLSWRLTAPLRTIRGLMSRR
ncbi:MAG: hypothetical protein ABFS37_00250 [Acidobacteriota bacterium]